ncbi:hypothetical protein [sulfur-oxidizing endosymbiont of Gigantopelta aegis]|uniref:hypothetical protein n=1 Tax=sulfur-oxidizing endosymbiont of Gigantopelta aegis TaxID=2794934 RepID=UPI001BE437B2|nr:hypothetical protein [sulfur-oxidizing endosymbiont of Gigantopelta aegis]
MAVDNETNQVFAWIRTDPCFFDCRESVIDALNEIASWNEKNADIYFIHNRIAKKLAENKLLIA